jgi:hypothetical protein
MPSRFALPLLALVLLAAAPVRAEPGRHALLIGCSRYDGLPAENQLSGAPNDAALLKRVLRERYGFADGDFLILTEDEGKKDPARRPTKANIKKAFEQLKGRVHQGDQVVVWLSGHGCRLAERHDPPPGVEKKPGGMRQLFLPADVRSWDEDGDQVGNAILDYELRGWIQPLLDEGASVWVIVDACFSGTLLRSASHERVKGVEPAVLKIPDKVFDEARKKAEGSKQAWPPPPEPPLALARGKGSLAAVYASQPYEKAPETTIVGPDGKERSYSLLTYTLCQELLQARTPMTYGELVQKIRARYAVGPPERVAPTPLAEFDRDRLVLGQTKLLRAPFAMTKHKGGWTIDGGTLHGLTPGSILEVRPPAGEGDEVVGHVVVKDREIDALTAEVAPTAAGNKDFPPAPSAKLVDGCRCHPVSIAYADLRPAAALVLAEKAGPDLDRAARTRLQEALARRTDELRPLGERLGKDAAEQPFRLVDGPAAADWLVCVAGPKEFYLGRSGELLEDAAGPTKAAWVVSAGRGPNLLLPQGATLPYKYETAEQLIDALGRVARVALLKRLADAEPPLAPAGSTENDPGLRAEVKLLRKKDREEINLSQRLLPLRQGDELICKVINRSDRRPFYAVVLQIDADFGVTQLYPAPGQLNLKLAANKDATPDIPVEVGRGKAAGPEQLLILVVDSTRGPVDFSVLGQPGLDRPAGDAPKGEEKAFESPLGQVLRHTLYGKGATRGVTYASADSYFLILRSWNPQREEKKEKPAP